MDLTNRIDDFATLGKVLQQLNNNKSADKISRSQEDYFNKLLEDEKNKNPWFTTSFIQERIAQLTRLLNKENLTNWLSRYPEAEQSKTSKKIAVIMAGNIPLVGFHDALCVLITGHYLIAKYSSKDFQFLQFIFQLLTMIRADWKERIQFTDSRPTGFDAIIATGSNNASRYFNYYFGDYPHIIRKNRNSIGILDGHETKNDYHHLGWDIFQFYGLGCRNIAKIYVPENFQLASFYEGIRSFSWVIDHYKYANNYDYNKTVWLMQNESIFDNGFLLLKKDKSLSSPIGSLYFEEYTSEATLSQEINKLSETIQCIASRNTIQLGTLSTIPFGSSQEPALWDYADQIDTILFLINL